MKKAKKKRSFLDEFLKIKKADGICIKDRSKGFKYLHKTITKRMAEGQEFRMGDIDFSKFTEDDISDYLRYYENNLEPIAYETVSMLNHINRETSKIPRRRQYRSIA